MVYVIGTLLINLNGAYVCINTKNFEVFFSDFVYEGHYALIEQLNKSLMEKCSLVRNLCPLYR